MCCRHPAASSVSENGNANDLAIRLRIEAEIGGLDGLFDVFQDGRVPGRDHDQLRFRSRHLRQLADGRGRAVVVHLDLVEHVHAGAAGARGRKAGLESSNGWSIRRLRSALSSLSAGIPAMIETAMGF